MSDEKLQILYCSFCGKSQHQVRKLIAGPIASLNQAALLQ